MISIYSLMTNQGTGEQSHTECYDYCMHGQNSFMLRKTCKQLSAFGKIMVCRCRIDLKWAFCHKQEILCVIMHRPRSTSNPEQFSLFMENVQLRVTSRCQSGLLLDRDTCTQTRCERHGKAPPPSSGIGTAPSVISSDLTQSPAVSGSSKPHLCNCCPKNFNFWSRASFSHQGFL